jgi:GNAT superfamily N-acetyltransferase
MTPRLPAKEYRRGRGAGNKRAMKKLVEGGAEPGLLAYRGKRAVGWCAVGPRAEFVRYATSRVAKPIDAKPAWAIPCLFVDPAERGTGVSAALVRAAVEHARKRGAERVEAFPTDPRKNQKLVPVFAWTGIASTFRAAGFVELARRTRVRPYMRREL